MCRLLIFAMLWKELEIIKLWDISAEDRKFK